MKVVGKVVVGMSGGVDSSVAAVLLAKQGFDVTGVMLKLWSEPGEERFNRCCAPDSMAVARRVAAQSGIPFYVLDAKEIFKRSVVEPFINGYATGNTPNPCLECNRWVRWGFLLDYAISQNIDFIATGHYARITEASNGLVELRKGIDSNKDQSYVLSVLTQAQMAHTLLPLGELTKPEVRQLAHDFKLETADRPESQDLCFLGGKDYREFLSRYKPELNRPGEIHTRQGQRIGNHRGLAFYTIGQRKGLGIAAPEPLYVLEKELQNNFLIVGTHQEMGTQRLIARNVNWLSGQTPIKAFNATVKIRYKALDAPAIVEPLGNDQFIVTFDQVIRDITPGQSAVVYQGDLCLGSGVIAPQ